jgi:hypothetical protein
MSFFAEDKPTKRVELGDGHWVELQHLSKGQKNTFQSELASMFKGTEYDANTKDLKSIPENFVGKTQEIEYRKIVAAIRSWSAGKEVSVETIKALSDEYYDRIAEEVEKMNDLPEKERKN